MEIKWNLDELKIDFEKERKEDELATKKLGKI
jgi:hypothetical protein